MTGDPIEEALRRALDARAEEVRVGPDGLERIRERIARPAWWQRPVLALPALAGVAAAGVVVAALAWPAGDEGGTAGTVSSATTSASPSPSSTPSPAPTPTPTPTPSPTTSSAPGATTMTLPIYYVGETTQGPRLYREFREVPTAVDPGALSADERVTLAVQFLLDTPALDPDYGSPWPAGLVASARTEAGVVTLDLAFPEDAGFDFDELGVQQLVYTVTAVLQQNVAVQLSFNGAPSSAPPVSRAAPATVQAAVWISSPQEGDTVGRTFTVSGTAAVFEATLSYDVRREDGTLVTEGFTNTAEGQAFAPYEFSLTLEPGTYVIEAYESSAEDGSRLFAETRTVTVR